MSSPKPLIRKVKQTPKLRTFHIAEGLPNLTLLTAELQDYTDVLLGRTPPPIDHDTLTLMEVADAYYARACEIAMLIHEGERNGTVLKNSPHYKFRTGELRVFMEMTKRAADLGSRRLTQEQIKLMQERKGRESAM